MPRTIDAPGIYDIPMDEYHADPCVEPSISSSGLRLMLDCPARFWAHSPRNPNRVPQGTTDAFEFGKAAHILLIEGEEAFADRCHVLSHDTLRTNAAKDEKAQAEAEGKTVIKPAAWDTVRAMRDALDAHPWARAAFQTGKVEQTLVWKDPASGTWQRVRPDFLPDKRLHVPDYKTAASCKLDDFQKAIERFGYHIQAAHYLDGIQAVTGAEPKHFFFVVQEKDPPYLVNAVWLEPETLGWGRIEVATARAKFAECLRTGHWPGYSDKPEMVGLPTWAKQRLEVKHGEGAFMYSAFAPAAE